MQTCMKTPGTGGPMRGKMVFAHGPLGLPVATTTWWVQKYAVLQFWRRFHMLMCSVVPDPFQLMRELMCLALQRQECRLILPSHQDRSPGCRARLPC